MLLCMCFFCFYVCFYCISVPHLSLQWETLEVAVSCSPNQTFAIILVIFLLPFHIYLFIFFTFDLVGRMPCLSGLSLALSVEQAYVEM